ncbi:zinc ribbon domain-containing protein [Sphingomonas sp. RT2P30]|uniref:zinc ribbon domain-containing protein n=1 Tax=Parasphingomonas halimpatiens TaxID=3096162 RepID=UPI002FC9B3F2
MSLPCQACGHTLESGANFCSACGAKQAESATHWRTTADDDLRAARAFSEDARQRATGSGDSSLGARMAKGAAIGAVAAIPIPFVGPITGAIVGAGIAAYTKLSKG